MEHGVTESTAGLLEAYRADLQGQLRLAGAVERIAIREALGLVTLVATVRVGGQQLQLTGTGTNVVEAYTDLRRTVPEPILASAFEQVLDA